MKQETVTINGISYDATTGLPVLRTVQPKRRPPKIGVTKATVPSRPTPKLAPKVVGERVVLKKQSTPKAAVTRNPATARVKKPRKSVTLNRKYVAKPVNKVRVSVAPSAVKKHPEVSHFTNGKPLPQPIKLPVRPVAKPVVGFPVKPVKTPKNLVTDIRRLAPRLVAKKPASPKPKPKPVPTPHKALPIEEIDNVFSEVTKSIGKDVKKNVRKARKSPKTFYIVTGVAVVVLIAGIVALFRLPQIEMMIAARHAGMDGRLPTYSVPGYKIDGSINYASGQVKIAYWNTWQNEKYVVVESTTTESDQELAINDGTATFVRHGIHYYITYSALSEEQVRRIANSL
jgi:hypothetical protein